MFLLTDAATLFEDAVEGVDEAVLVVLVAQVRHIFVHALLVELALLSICTGI
jgi:hypothetical protein